MTCMEYGELFAAINAQKVDIGFVIDLDIDTRSRCDSFTIYEDHFDAIVAHDHPLAAHERTGITSDMLCGEKLLLPDPAAYPGMSDFVEGILTKCGAGLIAAIATWIPCILMSRQVPASPCRRNITYLFSAIWRAFCASTTGTRATM